MRHANGFVPLAKKGGVVAGLALCATAVAWALAGTPTQLATTLNDFTLPGTQPGGLDHPIMSADSCASCHGFYDQAHEPYSTWSGSMMGQAMRDPVFLAALTIANQDADFGGASCLRCHSPSGFLEERYVPTDGSNLNDTSDIEGVGCNFCHRMVDPVYKPGVSPAVDLQILTDLGPDAPTQAQSHSAAFVVDPLDRRRGPYDEGPNFFYHDWEQSPFHQDSNMCASCHDVSNSIYTAQPDGTYALNALDTPHPTGNVYDAFPEQRTYSEWLKSDFAKAPVAIGDRYETTLTEVSSCQDCHMPEVEAKACMFEDPRPHYSTHSFSGGNNWVLNAIRGLNPGEDFINGLVPEVVELAVDRTEGMLRAASDMELSEVGGNLNVRLINQTGHKLPTGYPEGRRMWVNVQFFDAGGAMIAEHGAYDDLTATLTTNDTKVYEMKIGVDAAISALTGIPEGPGFHLILANKVYKDNRIPPRGFDNAEFASIQAAPVGYSYDDGQYWDDTQYDIPAGAARAEVRAYFQTSTKEYMEFLRDANVTNTLGQEIYDEWVNQGMSPIVEMDMEEYTFAAPCPADLNGDGVLNFFDVSVFLNAYSNQNPIGDFNGDGQFNFFDISAYLSAYSAGCP